MTLPVYENGTVQVQATRANGTKATASATVDCPVCTVEQRRSHNRERLRRPSNAFSPGNPSVSRAHNQGGRSYPKHLRTR